MRRFFAFILCLAALVLSGCKKEPSLSLSGPASLELSAGGGSSSASFTVNRDWTASTSDSWVSVSPSSGTASDGPVTVTVTASPNTTYEDRTATVTIRAEGLSQSITVRQPANLGVVIPTKSFEIASDARTVEVTVQSNVDYTVSVSASWIKQTGTKALTSKTLVFSVEENTSYDPRSATITVKPQSGGEAEQVISVKQAQKDALQVSKATYGMPYGGGEIDVKVEANVAFEVKSGVDWIQYVNTKGLSSSTVVLRVAGNATYESREGKVTIQQKNGSLSISVTVKQDGRVAVTGVTLDKSNLSLQPGETATLTATVKPDNASDKNVAWSSSDEKVATVSSDGTVTAVAEGTAKITAKAGEKSATCTVTVSSIEKNIRNALMKIYNTMGGPNWKKKNGWGTDAALDSWDGVDYNVESHELNLYFDGFGLQGEFPDCFGDLTSLVGIWVNSEPGVTGTLPNSFAKLVNLRSISLYNTSLSSLPDVFGGMKDLDSVFIYYNLKMTGPLPESLGNSDKLEAFLISYTHLEGPIPASWAKLADIQGFNLERNHLSGKIPDSFLNVKGEKLAYRLACFIQQEDGYGFDISGLDIPGYWPLGTIKSIDGKTFTFADVVKKNKYTVYLSWATWCPYSYILMPAVKDYYENYKKDGLEIIATVWHPEDVKQDNHGFNEEERLFEEQYIHSKRYDAWYNFYFGPYYGNTRINHLTPVAEVYDSNGYVLFSTQYNLPDPVRKRYGTNEGDYSASMDLIPFLESLLGPAEIPDSYASKDYSKDGEVLTLQKATKGKGINIVFLGDAYTDKDMGNGGLYETVMKQAMEEFFAIEPYKSYRNRFNVYAVKVVSKNGRVGEGYTTALGSRFNGGTDVSGDMNKCFEYASKVPGITGTENMLVSVLVNTKRNVGTTYMFESSQSCIAFSSSANNDPGVFGITLRHESGGHGFGFLADEYSEHNQTPSQDHIDQYTIPYQKYGWFANVDFTQDPKKIRWSAFLSDSRYKDEVGVLEGAALYSKGAWRPSENSMMRDNYEFFNAPSRWAIYQRIMKLSGEECTFEGFLNYDAVNRGKKQTAVRPPVRMPSGRESGTPPVIVP